MIRFRYRGGPFHRRAVAQDRERPLKEFWRQWRLRSDRVFAAAGQSGTDVLSAEISMIALLGASAPTSFSCPAQISRWTCQIWHHGTILS